MIRWFWATLAFLKWYFACYLVYFCTIVILSAFGAKLGFSEGLVRVLNYVFQYTDRIRKNSTEELEDDTPVKRNAVATNDLDSKLYSPSILQNGAIPKYSSTIKRDVILLPEFRDDFHVQLVDNFDDEEPNFSESSRNVYELSDITMYIRAGIEAIVEDQITSRFEAEKLENWNLMTRTNPHLRFYNLQEASLWLIGFLFRYLGLLPVRLLNCIFSLSLLVLCMTLVGYIPNSKYKKVIFKSVSQMCFHVITRWLGCVLRFHNVENRTEGGVVVSNHTTPFDVLMLNVDQSYSLTGQRHSGFIGFLERTLSRASPHIWFDRSVISDRGAVARRLREHVNDSENPPILIFPEGTCINNTAVTQFKKGAFEVSSVVHPIAIKYDSRFGNAFWNSSKQSALQHVLEMMTSWCIVGDIWYLPPIRRKPDETAVQFANRVKSEIAKQMNVIDLTWDGQVKRSKAKPEWKELHRKLFYEKLKSRLRISTTQ